jgi:hypothetical protein
MITEPDTPPAAPAQMPASQFDIQAPYAPGAPDPVMVGGDADPGGRDDVAGDVAGAMANAMARQAEHKTDTYAQGSTVGDLLDLPAGPSTASVADRPYWEEA